MRAAAGAGALVLALAAAGGRHADGAASAAAQRHVGGDAAPAQIESLLVTGQRLARTWSRHDFGGLLAGHDGVQIQLPGRAASPALRADQAAELLRAWCEGSVEVSVEVAVARNVDRDRAYVEVERLFATRGTAAQRQQTLFFGLRRVGAGYRLYEVRVLP